MASTYSSNIRLEIMANGENDSTWGTKTSTNLQLLEAAVAGRAAVTHDDTANYTLTTANGSADEARRMILNIGGALSAARNVVCPTQSKFYVVKNATTGGYAVTLKTSGGTGISVPNGKTMLLFCDGTNVVEAIDTIGGVTFAGTTGTTMTFPSTSATIARTDAANTFTGVQGMTSPSITTSIVTPSTTFAVFNDTATTINAFGAATTVNMGAGAASTANLNFTTAINLNTAAVNSNQSTLALYATPTTVTFAAGASTALTIGHASAAAAFPGGISIPTGKNVTGTGTATVTGFATVSATSLAGTLTTAAQPNITSVGTLTGGALGSGFGNISIGSSSITAGAGSFTTGAFTGNLSTDSILFVNTAKNRTTIKSTNTQAVANSATSIWTAPTGNEGGLFVVYGKATAASNYFIDLVFGSDATDTVYAITSQTMAGTPTARTYTWVSDALKLAMADANTYDVTVASLVGAFPD